jgi:hypothetical protein
LLKEKLKVAALATGARVAVATVARATVRGLLKDFFRDIILT